MSLANRVEVWVDSEENLRENSSSSTWWLQSNVTNSGANRLAACSLAFFMLQSNLVLVID